MKEDNRLIAKFMGFVIKDGIIQHDPQFHSNGNKEGYRADGFLNFHKSWDWLMPVVEKIEALNNAWEIDIYRNNCEIFMAPVFNIDDVTFTSKTKLEATYKAIIEFIKWYSIQ